MELHVSRFDQLIVRVLTVYHDPSSALSEHTWGWRILFGVLVCACPCPGRRAPGRALQAQSNKEVLECAAGAAVFSMVFFGALYTLTLRFDHHTCHADVALSVSLHTPCAHGHFAIRALSTPKLGSRLLDAANDAAPASALRDKGQ